MSHQIQETDLTFSVDGAEWMGLAQSPTGNNESTREEKIAAMVPAIRENLCPPIVERGIVAMDENGNPDLDCRGVDGHKIIAADFSAMPVHPGREVHPSGRVFLGKPKNGYVPFPFEAFLEICLKAFAALGLPCPILTAGTLGDMTKFYFSVSLAGLAELKTPDGHAIAPFLSFLSSHDGALAPTVKDSWIRVVCANTFAAVLRAVSGFQLTGKHTVNGLASLENLGALLEAYVKGSQEFSTDLEKLANRPVTLESSREIVAGYFFSDALRNGTKIPDSVEMTTQSMNATESIVIAARHGQGNTGETEYDLWNGATDYWSHAGTGSSKVGLRKKVSMSQFGAASEHKTSFTSYLLDSDLVTDARKVARTAMANSN